MCSYQKKIKNPKYFKIDEFVNDKITQYNKNIDLNLVKSEFEVEFINFNDFKKTEYFFNTSIVIMKNYLKYYIYPVISRERTISHIHKMKIKTISKYSYMNYKYYLNEPMQTIERRLNMNIAKNSQLINSLNRGSDHPLNRNYRPIPFSD